MGASGTGRAEVHVRRDSLGFAAAHFGIIGGDRETLHGHNYTIAVSASGPVGDDGTVVDFGALKAAVRAEAARLDHRMLVPTRCPEVTVEVEADGQHVALRHRASRFLLPVADAALLPIRNTTCECLAGLLLERVRERVGPAPVVLAITVEESPGQGATVVEPLVPG